MKKLFIVLFFFAITSSVNAQLANTRWKGTIQADETIDVVLHFANDTLNVINTGDLSTIEAMTFTAKGDQLTIQKISGQSDCSSDAVSTYKYEIKNNEITLVMVEDPCDQRGAVLNNSKWTKVEY